LLCPEAEGARRRLKILLGCPVIRPGRFPRSSVGVIGQASGGVSGQAADAGNIAAEAVRLRFSPLVGAPK
jgi:hypothetical protein